jgi:hypothetical protein
LTSRRRQLIAVVPVMAATLLVAGGGLTPHGLDKPLTNIGTAMRALPIAAAHSGQLYFSNLLVIFGLGALGVSFCAISTVPRGRGSTIATVGGAVGLLGAFCGAIINVLVGYNLAAAASARVSSGAAARILVETNTSLVAGILFVGYLGGLALATLLMGLGLWRSEQVPRWLSVLFVVGVLTGAASPPGGIGVVLSLPFVLAMVLLARVLWPRGAGAFSSEWLRGRSVPTPPAARPRVDERHRSAVAGHP